ncbi:bacteriohemerythrin [Rhabdochromatium marinum]|uniref:bacteriohemerythrin n=1 Tax=Rhabdochromatium marinum TaxID=48729 RepID=UPI001905998E|nr:bacteriohemerythrin [Rhabdochromatium marinum]MBK1648759.1 hypothetical protein [Rhabdochromatium marinum]
MSLIDWNDALSVGVEEIDDDHQRLVEIVNQLNDAIAAKHQQDVIETILQELLEYTVWHFRHEERLMQASGDPSFMQHKQAHDTLTEQVKAAQQRYLDGDATVADTMLPFLKDWLINHILGTDKTTGQYLAKNAE